MKRLIFFSIVIISLFVIQNMLRSMYGLWQKHDLLTQAEKELAQEIADNGKLKDQLATVENPNFVEHEARDKLFLEKPGESRVMVDQKLIEAVAGEKTEVQVDTRPNWQRWWELFF